MKTKKIWRLLAMVCVLAMLTATFAVHALAVGWNGTACPNCGKTTNIGTYNGPLPTWVTYTQNVCSHGTGGVDYYQRYTGQIHCFNCGREYSGTIYRILCASTGNTYHIEDVKM